MKELEELIASDDGAGLSEQEKKDVSQESYTFAVVPHFALFLEPAKAN